MSIIHSFDTSEEIIKPEMFTSGQKRLPKIAICVFKTELITYISQNDSFKEYSTIQVCGDNVKIYTTTINNVEIAIYRTYMGAPSTIMMMEELHSRGVETFIIFGSCGQLTSDLKKNVLLIPTDAYRDEGTSYHYLPASDFVKIISANDLGNFFDKENIPYEFVKTWTTDSLFKETKQKVQNRIESGCKVVEMECASIMAVAQSRGFNAYQFLYTDDSLETDDWDIKTLVDDRTPVLVKCLNIALSITKYMI